MVNKPTDYQLKNKTHKNRGNMPKRLAQFSINVFENEIKETKNKDNKMIRIYTPKKVIMFFVKNEAIQDATNNKFKRVTLLNGWTYTYAVTYPNTPNEQLNFNPAPFEELVEQINEVIRAE